MNHLTLLALMIGLTAPTLQHQWAPLVLTSAERIDIDTATVQNLGPAARRVWLRWDFDRAASVAYEGVVGPQYLVEQRDIDCAAYRTRVLQKHRDWDRPTGAGGSISTREASWQTPPNGSLLAQVFEAACRFTKAGA
jgi:hypothetical protein